MEQGVTAELRVQSDRASISFVCELLTKSSFV